MEFEPTRYGQVLAPLVAVDRRRPLDAGDPAAGGREDVGPLSADSAFSHAQVADVAMAHCCVSGVLLLHDRLDESHTLSQSIPTAEGSFWHAIMHRREGDFSNSKYWFRRVGAHPVLEELADRFGGWDPFEFVDRCAAALRTGEDVELCLEAQQAEWEHLFDWCYRRAVGE